MRAFFVMLLTMVFSLSLSCSESGFTSSGASRNITKDKKERADDEGDKASDDAGDDGKDDNKSGGKKDSSDPDEDSDLGNSGFGDEDLEIDSTDAEGKPDGLIEIDDGTKVIRADYTACAALPAAGKQGYGKCADNSVVVIINDGKAQEQTCCPLGGKNILSSKESERHVLRTGSCQSDEVLTGMQSATGNSGYCSKINTKYLKLSPSVPSQYVKGNAPGVLGQIAKSYNVSDTCICPEGTVALLGHTASDNQCAEKCVKIEEKK
jgi:hypothetical protein